MAGFLKGENEYAVDGLWNVGGHRHPKAAYTVRIEEWLQDDLFDDLFRMKWWFLLGLAAPFLFAWWKLIDKTRLPEIMLYAVLTMILLTMGIVEYGEELTCVIIRWMVLAIYATAEKARAEKPSNGG